MSTTDKYDWDLTDYGTTGWNGILKSFTEGVDEELHTVILGTLGETVVADDIVYLKSDGKYWKAKGSAGLLPAAGVAIEAGNASDEIRIQRMGPYTPANQATLATGGKIYISGATAGAWTQTKPSSFSQSIGRALSGTAAFIWVEDVNSIHYGTAASPATPTNYEDGTLYLQYTA